MPVPTVSRSRQLLTTIRGVLDSPCSAGAEHRTTDKGSRCESDAVAQP